MYAESLTTVGSPSLTDSDTAARIALAAAGVTGDISVAIGIDAAGGAASFVAAVHDREDSALPLSNPTRERIRTLATGRAAAQLLEQTRRKGLAVFGPHHERWPSGLAVMKRSVPLLLWVKGDPTVFERPAVAVTGSAAPTSYGIHVAFDLSLGLANHHWIVAARAGSGIDEIALKAAVAMGATPVAVAATGVDRARVPEGTVVVSEVPPGTEYTVRTLRRAKFLLAALAAKTVVIEAATSSGAVRTAEAAYSFGRPVGVVPGPVISRASDGCHDLARRHQITLVTSVRDIEQLR